MILLLALAGVPPGTASGADVPDRVSGIARVVDGDTNEIEAHRIRIEGIDAPEAGQTCIDRQGAEWRCGRSSARRLETLTAGREVVCRPLYPDRHGRLVARCDVGGLDLGGALVEDGTRLGFRQVQRHLCRPRGGGTPKRCWGPGGNRRRALGLPIRPLVGTRVQGVARLPDQRQHQRIVEASAHKA